jgi:hypothetical protein
MILTFLAVAFAAFCVWLTVRIANRRVRRAKWTAVVIIVALLGLYPFAWGPWVCFKVRREAHHWTQYADRAFRPLEWLAERGLLPDWYWDQFEKQVAGCIANPSSSGHPRR